MKEVKLFFFIFHLSILACSHGFSQSKECDTWLAKAKKDEKYGYINSKGKQIVPIEFDMVGFFKEGHVWVKKGDLFGLYNYCGELVVPVKYKGVEDMSCGLVLVVNKEDKIGYLNGKGEVVIDFIYNTASSFNGGIATIHDEDERYNKLINRKGDVIYDNNNKEARPLNFEFENLSDGRAMFVVWRDNGYDSFYGFLDETGKVMVPPIYSTKVFDNSRHLPRLYYSYYNGRAAVGKSIKRNGINQTLWGYIDSLGSQVVECNYSQADTFNNWGFAYVSDTLGKSLLIKKDGTPIFPPGKYQLGYLSFGGGNVGNTFHDGLLNVIKDEKTALINIKGEEIIPFNDWKISSPVNGNYLVSKRANGVYMYAVFNSEGEVVQDFIPYSYKFALAPRLSEGLIPFKDSISRTWGYKNLKYETIIAPRFERVESFKNGIALVKENNGKACTFGEEWWPMTGYINKSGKYLFTEYDSVGEFKKVEKGFNGKCLDSLNLSSEEIFKTIIQIEYSEEE